MIYDRTQQDVESAIQIRKEKVQTFQELSTSDIETLEKGTITVNTLNRIENKQEELKNLFNNMGYWNIPITNKSWDSSQIFDISELRRLIDNLNVLRDAFFVYNTTPNTPNATYNYNDINALEKILHDLGVMINDIKSKYRRCGTFKCGE